MIKELVEKLGISRRTLSIFLDSTQSHLSKYENHTRNLPLAAIPGVTQLYAWLENVPAPPVPQPTAADKAKAAQKGGWCRAELSLLQQKLEKAQTAWGQGATLLYIVQQYEAANPQPSPKMKSWIAGQHFTATQKMKDNGWEARQRVQHKIALLETEIRFWDAVVAIGI